MPVFSYTFRDASGGIQKGTADAESEEILRRRFEEQGFTITEVAMLRAKSAKVKSFGRVKLQHLSVFCRQFSTMVDAGVSLVRCLDVLCRPRRKTPDLRRFSATLESGLKGAKAFPVPCSATRRRSQTCLSV